MTNIQAAIGVAQLEQVDKFVNKKREAAAFYRQALENCPYLALPVEKEWAKNSYWLFTVQLQDESRMPRETLAKKLLLNGVETRPVFYPLHQMPPYQQYYGGQSLEVSKEVARKGLSLPTSCSITEEQLEGVTSAINSIFSTDSLVNESEA